MIRSCWVDIQTLIILLFEMWYKNIQKKLLIYSLLVSHAFFDPGLPALLISVRAFIWWERAKFQLKFKSGVGSGANKDRRVAVVRDYTHLPSSLLN